MSKIIILGDPHIGKSSVLSRATIGSALNSRVIDQSNLLDWTLDQAIEHQATHIIITGDIFDDPKPHPSLLALFIGWVKKCQANGIQLHIIIGNHDLLRSGNFYTSPLDVLTECEIENVSVYNSIDTIFIDNLAFTLIPFRDRKSFNVDSNATALALLQDNLVYELSLIPISFTKIVVGHLAIEDSIPVGDEIDDLSNELFCSVEMFAGYDYVWMGHVHTPQVMSRDPYIAHIGSMDISNFGETDQKKILVLIDSSNPKFFQEIPIPTRALRKISVSIPQDTKDTTQFVREEIEKHTDLNKAIVKVEIQLASIDLLDVDRSAIEKFLYQSGVFSVAGISQSKKIALIKQSESQKIINVSMDVPSSIKMYANAFVDRDKQDSFISLSKEIYQEFLIGKE
jgi:DNA repair exonuclease SbcCD nuclease subunit